MRILSRLLQLNARNMQRSYRMRAFLVCFSFVLATLVAQSVFAYDSTKFPGKGTIDAWEKASEIALAAYNLAKQGKRAEALKQYQQAISVYPYAACDYHDCGYECHKLGDNKTAVQYLKKAIEMAPDFELAWLTLGNTYEDLKDYPAAEHAFKKAVELNPKYIDAVVDLADLYILMRRPEDARKYLSIANGLPRSNEPKVRGIIDEEQAKLEQLTRALRQAGE